MLMGLLCNGWLIYDYCFYLSGAERECGGLGLFYQTLKFTDAGSKYLQGSIQHAYSGGTEVSFVPVLMPKPCFSACRLGHKTRR
jgi:hypothetical protein